MNTKESRDEKAASIASPSPRCLCDDRIDAPVLWFEDKDVHLVKCHRCGLIYADPMPDLHGLVSQYDQLYFTQRWPEHVLKAQETLFTRQLSEISQIQGIIWEQKKSVLDIGCGLGVFLEVALQAGWNAYGVEPSPAAATYTSRRLRIPIKESTLEEAGFSDEMFDVVHMSHVLEHVPQPIQTLQTVHRLLKVGGVLYLEVPKETRLYESLFQFAYRYILKISSPRPPFVAEHLYIFTIKTLQVLAQMTGFNIVKSYLEGMRAPGRFYTSHTGPLVTAIGAAIKIMNLDIVLGGGNIVLIATKEKGYV